MSAQEAALHDDWPEDEEPEVNERKERRMAERRQVDRARDAVKEILKWPEQEALELPLHDAVRRSLLEYHRIPTRGTGVRARHRLKDRMIRELRMSNLDEVELAVGLGGAARTAKDDAMLALEGQRARLLDGGDEALEELLSAHPQLDRQQLRQLLRQARKDGGRGKAYKKLFAILREVSGV